MPSPFWTATAVAGKVLSGVEVASTIRSIAWRIDTGMFQRRARSVDRQMRSVLAFGSDMALPDAGALHDPLVGSIDTGGEFRIGQYLLRQIGAAAQHDRTFRSHETTSCAICACTSALILVRRSQRTIS